jgi:hypothetical protein
MTGKRLLPVLCALVLALTAGGAPLAAEADPQAAPAVQELEELLFGEVTKQVSVDPQAASAGVPSTDAGWWYGICSVSCYYCVGHGDCPYGESCLYNYQCP